MCYKSPGPRCSAWAKRRLQAAQDAWYEAFTQAQRLEAMESLKEAEKEFDGTPQGQKELRESIALGKDKDGILSARLERGIAHRALSLRLLKSEDKGDIKDQHVAPDYVLDAVQTSELFPQEKVLNLLDQMAKQHGEPSVGRTRAVYDTGDGYVTKVPLSWEGVMQSGTEANWDNEEIPVAECQLVDMDGIPVLRMEKVQIEHASYKDLPDWVGFVDGGQVGRTKEGRLVAYDL